MKIVMSINSFRRLDWSLPRSTRVVPYYTKTCLHYIYRQWRFIDVQEAELFYLETEDQFGLTTESVLRRTLLFLW